MSLHPKFPTSPYEPLIPEQRWFPADETLRATAYEKLLPPLVAKIREAVFAWRAGNRDGNGRSSRLLFLLATYHCGLEVGRYISFERLIEQNKERYYEVLEQSSQGWHEGKHDPWPTINFLLYTLTQACKEVEQRVGQMKSPRGEKTAMIHAAIDRQVGTFRVADLQADCPGVGLDLIRLVLDRLRKQKKVESLGTGRGARWQKLETM